MIVDISYSITIRDDMMTWEREGLWPLSCYTPSCIQCPNLPELEDYSVEEIRYLAYQCATGNTQQYVSETPNKERV